MFFLVGLVAAFIALSSWGSNSDSYRRSYSEPDPPIVDRIIDLPIEELKSMIIQNINEQTTAFNHTIQIDQSFNLFISEITVVSVEFTNLIYQDQDIDFILNPKYNEVIVKGTIQSIKATVNLKIKDYSEQIKFDNYSFFIEKINLDASFSLHMNYLKFNNDRFQELRFARIIVYREPEKFGFIYNLTNTWCDYLLETFKDSFEQTINEIHSNFLDLSLLKIRIFPDNQQIQSTEIRNDKTFTIKARIREDKVLKLI